MTPGIIFVNFLLTRQDSFYVHINVSYQFGSFVIEDIISHMRNMQLKF